MSSYGTEYRTSTEIVVMQETKMLVYFGKMSRYIQFPIHLEYSDA